PFAGRKVPADIGSSRSLEGYVVVTFNPASAAVADRERRCQAASRIIRSLPSLPEAWVFHPLAVTPYHADYLALFDVVERRRKEIQDQPAGSLGGLRVRARGVLAQKLLGASARDASAKDGAAWDATVEDVSLDTLLAAPRIHLDGWLGPPWLK